MKTNIPVFINTTHLDEFIQNLKETYTVKLSGVFFEKIHIRDTVRLKPAEDFSIIAGLFTLKSPRKILRKNLIKLIQRFGFS